MNVLIAKWLGLVVLWVSQPVVSSGVGKNRSGQKMDFYFYSVKCVLLKCFAFISSRGKAASTEYRENALFWVSWEAPAQQAPNMLFDFDTLPSHFLFSFFVFLLS